MERVLVAAIRVVIMLQQNMVLIIIAVMIIETLISQNLATLMVEVLDMVMGQAILTVYMHPVRTPPATGARGLGPVRTRCLMGSVDLQPKEVPGWSSE